MKFLELGDMLTLLPADSQTELAAEARLLPMFERCKSNPTRLRTLTTEGHLRTAQVNIAGKPVAVFWYRVELERLIVDTIVSVANEENTLPRAVEAMKQVAVANGCKVIEGVTARAGVADALAKMDWYAVGVVLRKDI